MSSDSARTEFVAISFAIYSISSQGLWLVLVSVEVAVPLLPTFVGNRILLVLLLGVVHHVVVGNMLLLMVCVVVSCVVWENSLDSVVLVSCSGPLLLAAATIGEVIFDVAKEKWDA